MSMGSKRSAVANELHDWRVWLMVAICVVIVVRAALVRLGWRAVLLAALPVAALAFAGGVVWILRRPATRAGFAAEATHALATHLPPGTRPPRVLQARQTGDVWEVEWRLPSRTAGPALLKKTRDLEHELGAALQLRVDRDHLRMKAGTAEIQDLVTYEDFYRHQEPDGELVVGIGESRWGPVWTDLVKLPHVLIGGTTNFGKSVMVCQILTRLVLRYLPEHLKLALVDFKRVELSMFEGLPHVTPPDGQAASLAVAKDLDSYVELLRVLSDSLDERKLRFDLAGGVKNIQAWNRRPDLGGRLPYVVLVIDELAELSVEEAADAEEKRKRQAALALLARMARLGRALGFHIIAATQRPAVDTVPGPIKSQLLARCCFKVASGTESRVVLGEDNSAGAELPAHPGRGIWQWSEPVVFQGPLLTPERAEALLAGVVRPRVVSDEPEEACMSTNQFDPLDADQPIPLGHVAGPAACPATTSGAQPAMETQTVAQVPPADVEPPLAPPPAAVVVEPEVVPAMGSITPPGVGPAPPPAASQPPSDRPAQPGGPSLNGLRGFRLEPIAVEPAYGGRNDLMRFLVQFALVMAFVYALIVAFVLLVAHVRGTPA